MTTQTNRTELNPLEEIIIARTLESSTGQESLMNEINRLTEERNKLQAELVRHPWAPAQDFAQVGMSEHVDRAGRGQFLQ